MKKIKFTEVAAATLLAVAPVATTALTPVNTANAATTGASTQAGNILESLYNILKKYVDGLSNDKTQQPDDPSTIEDPATKAAVKAINGLKGRTFTNDDPVEKDTFKEITQYNNEKGSISEFSTAMMAVGSITDDDSDVMETIDKATNLQATISGSENSNDFEKIVNNFVTNGNGASFSINIKVVDTSQKDKLLVNRKLTYSNNEKVITPSSVVSVNYTSPLNVELNSEVLPTTLSDSVDATVTNDQGQNISYTEANPGLVYKNETDANTQNPNGSTITDHFDTDGATYYQPVILSFSNKDIDLSTIYKSVQHGEGASISLNGTGAFDYNVDTKNNKITFIRQIHVGTSTTDPDDNNNNPDTDNGTWSETDSAGIVTVNGSIASLQNDDNATTSWSLDANSAWQTDKYRTNSKTGQVQYRVSTHEWVNADKVSFAKKDMSAGMKNITDLSGSHSVTLAGPGGFVYALFNTNGSRSTRGLAGDSAWLTDKTATDAAGNTYYRVSTDEWVQASTGVSFN